MFIVEDELFGIRERIRGIWNLHRRPVESEAYGTSSGIVKEVERKYAFDIFFNQFLPEPWIADTAAVFRHHDEIVGVIKDKAYNTKSVWIWILDREVGRSVSYAIINYQLLCKLQDNKYLLGLPTYTDIEKEKQRWQRKATYREEEGKSNLIEEEFVQLHFHRRKYEEK